MQEPPTPPRRRGRPRSEPAHRALLEAALREFVVRGYEAMSLEAIASAAGVSKLTLYRHWDSKLALVQEVLQSLSDETPMEDQGSLEEDLRVLLREAYRAGTASPAGQIMPRLVGEIASHPRVAGSVSDKDSAPPPRATEGAHRPRARPWRTAGGSGVSHPGRYVRRSHLLPLDRARPGRTEHVG